MLTSTDKKLDSVSILNTQDVLQSSMSSLDSDTINEVILAVAKPNEESLPEIQKRKLESLEFQQELIEEEREESEEAKQELLSIKDKATSDKDKAKAAAKSVMLTETPATASSSSATAAASSSSALPIGYVPGAAGTGDEHLTSTNPSSSVVTASDVANAVMAATVKADINPRQGNTNTATGTSSGGTASVLSQTNVPANASSSSITSTTTSTIDTEETDYSVPPDLTLSELEAITDLARESVLEREKTELALIKANIVADTADDDDEANERNIENKQSGVAVAASKITPLTQTQSGSGHITVSHFYYLRLPFCSLSQYFYIFLYVSLMLYTSFVVLFCRFIG